MIPGLPANLASLIASAPLDAKNALAALQTLRLLAKPVDKAEQKRVAEEREKEGMDKDKLEAQENQDQ
jgi:hypothetical protein